MITEVGRILEMTHKAGLSYEKIQERKLKEEEPMKQRLESLIDKYTKKLALPVDNATKNYYSGKITAYEHAIILLDLNEEVN